MAGKTFLSFLLKLIMNTMLAGGGVKSYLIKADLPSVLHRLSYRYLHAHRGGSWLVAFKEKKGKKMHNPILVILFHAIVAGSQYILMKQFNKFDSAHYL